MHSIEALLPEWHSQRAELKRRVHSLLLGSVIVPGMFAEGSLIGKASKKEETEKDHLRLIIF